jgi:hypothetical protein
MSRATATAENTPCPGQRTGNCGKACRGCTGRVVGVSEALGLAEWAATYAAARLPVVPLHSIRDGRCTCRRDCGRNAGKHPLTAHGKDNATVNSSQVAVWWERWPWANIGIRLPAGVIVLDCRSPQRWGCSAGRAGPRTRAAATVEIIPKER